MLRPVAGGEHVTRSGDFGIANSRVRGRRDIWFNGQVTVKGSSALIDFLPITALTWGFVG
jgi:hypothetical protein